MQFALIFSGETLQINLTNGLPKRKSKHPNRFWLAFTLSRHFSFSNISLMSVVKVGRDRGRNCLSIDYIRNLILEQNPVNLIMVDLSNGLTFISGLYAFTATCLEMLIYHCCFDICITF